MDYVSLLLMVAPSVIEPVKLFTIGEITLRCHLIPSCYCAPNV